MHDHYPIDRSEGLELYEDLVDFAGLTHEQAVETAGYAYGYDVMMCPYVGDNWSPNTKESMFAFPFDINKIESVSHIFGLDDPDVSLYENGVKIGIEQARSNRGELTNV